MKTVHLHGALAAFGSQFHLDIRDPAEAVRALSLQLPGFRDAVAAGNWHVIVGPLETGTAVGESDLTVSVGDRDEIHLVPAIEGAGGGLGQILVGIVLVAVAVFAPGFGVAISSGVASGMIGAGAGLVIGGIVQMTTKVPTSDYGTREQSDQRPSFLFDGATNTSTQGLPVPVIYGRVKVGSVVISAGISSEEV